jgi:predicted HicB family RNase H-like nuclease
MKRSPRTSDIHLRVTPTLHGRLRDEADRRRVSVSYLAEKALEDLLEDLPPLDGAR